MRIKLTSIYVNDDAQARRMIPLGAMLTIPPTNVAGSAIAMLDDTRGDRLQVAALHRWVG